MHFKALIFSLLLSLLSTATAKSYSKDKDAVLLSNVKTLTLLADKQTSHRRVSAIPQLICVGGDAKGLYDVDVMRCKNSGAEYDAEDIQWTCQATLPPEFKLGSTEVVCEGYDNADDPYILKGSCGVEYRLILTEIGEQKYSKKFNERPTEKKEFKTDSEKNGSALNTLWTAVFWITFLTILGILFYKIFLADRNQGAIRLPETFFGGGGGGGGGNDDNNDPPPPYTPRPPPQQKPRSPPTSSRQPRTSNNSGGRGRGSSGGSGGSSGGSSGPGFWSGAATGGAAGYGAGYYMGSHSADRERERERERADEQRRETQRQYERERQHERERERSRERARERSRERQRERERERDRQYQSSMFGSGSNNTPSTGSFFGGGGGSSAPGPSSGKYESTGFGGTRRR